MRYRSYSFSIARGLVCSGMTYRRRTSDTLFPASSGPSQLLRIDGIDRAARGSLVMQDTFQEHSVVVVEPI